MKGLLNNPKVVGLLALAAFGVAGKNIFEPMFASPEHPSLADVPAAGLASDTLLTPSGSIPTEQTQTSSQSGTGAMSNRKIPQIGWELNAGRDPFRPLSSKTAVSEALQAAPEHEVAQAEQESAPEHEFMLGAIAIGSSFKLALIDNEVVRSGNVVADIEVSVVEARALELRNKDGAAQKISFNSSELRQTD